MRGKWNEQIAWLETIKQPFKILHLSDEFMNDPCFFYDWPRVRGVLRFYKRADITNEKVLTIPLGYHWPSKNGIPIESREYEWSFVGTDWNNRSSYFEYLKKIEPNYLKFYPSWNSIENLKQDEYISLLQNTKFVPCPAGNNIETFRFYEALESGCIPLFTELPPILEDSGIPLEKAESWDKVEFNITSYEAIMEAWKRYKISIHKKVSKWLYSM
jgi:hypothetical protein